MATMPSGSFNAAGFLLYDATLSSGYCINASERLCPDNIDSKYLW
jgi:hypothetical protein